MPRTRPARCRERVRDGARDDEGRGATYPGWWGEGGVKFYTAVQDLGWRRDGRYLPRRDDLASTAFWYQEAPGGRARICRVYDSFVGNQDQIIANT
jgi:hypothetical protein